MRQDITTHTSRATSPCGAQRGRLDQQAVRLVGAAVEQLRGLLLDQVRVLVGDPVERGVPTGVRVGQVDRPGHPAVSRPGRDDLVLDGLQGLPVLALEDPFDLVLHGAVQRVEDLALENPAAHVDPLGELLPRLLVELSRGPGQRDLGVLLGDQLRRVPHRDQRPRLRGEVAVVDLGEFLEGLDLVADDRGVLVQGLLGGDVGGVVHLSPVVLQASHRGDDRVHPVADPGGRVLEVLGPAHQFRDRDVRAPALPVQGGPGTVRRGHPGGRQAALLLQRERRLGAHGTRRPAQSRLFAQSQPLREDLRRRHTPHGGESDAGDQRQQDQGETYGAETAPGTGPWRHRRPRAISDERVRRMLSVQVTVRTVRDGKPC